MGRRAENKIWPGVLGQPGVHFGTGEASQIENEPASQVLREPRWDVARPPIGELFGELFGEPEAENEHVLRR